VLWETNCFQSIVISETSLVGEELQGKETRRRPPQGRRHLAEPCTSRVSWFAQVCCVVCLFNIHLVVFLVALRDWERVRSSLFPQIQYSSLFIVVRVTRIVQVRVRSPSQQLVSELCLHLRWRKKRGIFGWRNSPEKETFRRGNGGSVR